MFEDIKEEYGAYLRRILPRTFLQDYNLLGWFEAGDELKLFGRAHEACPLETRSLFIYLKLRLRALYVRRLHETVDATALIKPTCCPLSELMVLH